MSALSSGPPIVEDGRRIAPSVLAWDLPTRLFKWSLVILILTAWISSGFNDPTLSVHKAAGYGIFTLIVYRLLWGVFGGTTARFATFLKTPAAVLAYLAAVRSGKDRPYLGHNPAGGLVVVTLLLLCGVQVGLGLCASDGVLASGPLADLVGEGGSAMAATLHAIWFWVLAAVAAVHIAVNLFHQFIKRDNLIGAMITGRKAAAPFAEEGSLRPGSPLAALGCLLAAAAIVYTSISVLGTLGATAGL